MEERKVGEGLKETDEGIKKILYLCTINLLWNTDEM